MKEAFDCMPKAQFEFVQKVKTDMLKNTNMTEDEAWDFGFRCWQMGYVKVERKTNADRIRNMTDEELAEFLVNFKNTFGEEYEGIMSCLDWLKSPTTD